MIWTSLIGIIVFALFKFFSALSHDNNDLKRQPLEEKFEIIVSIINNAAFNGKGQITKIDNRTFNLYEDGKNEIINFLYSTGHLTITWKYKYFQKEVIHEKQYNDVRNLSIFEQQKIADNIITEMEIVVACHKTNILGDM